MELMVLRRAVLDGPVFHRPLMSGDGRRVVGVEEYRSGPVNGYEEIGGAVGIGRIRNDLGEIQGPMGGHGGGRKPFEALRIRRRESGGYGIIVVAVAVIVRAKCLDGSQRTVWIAITRRAGWDIQGHELGEPHG